MLLGHITSQHLKRLPLLRAGGLLDGYREIGGFARYLLARQHSQPARQDRELDDRGLRAVEAGERRVRDGARKPRAEARALLVLEHVFHRKLPVRHRCFEPWHG